VVEAEAYSNAPGLLRRGLDEVGMIGVNIHCSVLNRPVVEDAFLPLFEELAKRAAISIENAQLYEHEHEVAKEFQRAALPISLPQIPGIRFDGIYVPASRRAQLGGDWYDALQLADGRVVISIGDVAGSGLEAAVIMANVRQAIRGVAQVHADPDLMLEAADRALRSENPDRFVTAFVGVIDPIERTIAYQSAGHPPPLLCSGSGECASGVHYRTSDGRAAGRRDLAGGRAGVRRARRWGPPD